MKTKNINKRERILSFLLSACLLLTLFPFVSIGFAEEDTLVLSTAEEFLTFAADCNMDDRYIGKTVTLGADIDLSDTDFRGIPTFGGTFDGAGHTLSGLSLSGQGSRYGLFRYLQKSGAVENLTVSGIYDYSGDQKELGGIVGHNDGVVRSCTFYGTVHGENTVGGIVGLNTENGTILSCVSNGFIIGENSVGGIAGINNGLISGCDNHSFVNTVDEEYSFSVGGIDSDIQSTVENWMMSYKNDESINSGGISDAGGIAGFSDGVLQGCKNYGKVGYAHIGYNVGGVCGRQSGYLLSCYNYGAVNGRKDVGGIVGQAEPDVLLSINGTSLQTFRDEMDSLNSLVNGLIDHVDSSSDDLGTRLENISQYTKSASDEAQNMLDKVGDALDDTKDFANENIKEINTKAAILSDAVDQLIPVMDGMEDIADELNAAIDGLTDAINCLDIERPDTDKTVSDITDGMRKAADGMRYLKIALEDMRKAADNLDDAFDAMDWGKINSSLDDLAKALRAFSSSADDVNAALSSIRDILKGGVGSIDELPETLRAVLEQLGTLADSLGKSGESLKAVADALATFTDGIYVDYISLGEASDNMQGALNQLKLCCDRMETSLTLLADGLEEGHIVLSDWFDDVKEQWEEFSGHITDASEHMKKAVTLLSDSASNIADILRTISEGGPLHITDLDADFNIDNTALFDSLNGMGDEMDALRDSSLEHKDKFVDEIDGIVNKFDKIMNLLMDEVDALVNRSEDGSVFVDVSEEDLERTKQGKIALSCNYAAIEGDRNVGGIVGSMAIEYSADPEDDLEKPSTLNFTYNTKAVLQQCRNEGGVTGKKDYVGGIVGNMSLGTVYECESYAEIESSDGNYVGGIAGFSDTSIRKCFSKGVISGLQKVGGIAGRASSVSGCYAIVNVHADETLGAIVGEDCDKAGISQNYFLDKGLGAIDSVSYCDHAQPITYEELRAIETIPDRFLRFHVLFVAAGRKVSKLTVDYDTPVSELSIPGVPNRDGHYAAWEEFPEDTITGDIRIEAVYTPWVAAVESEVKNEKGLTLALVEGKFSDSTSLHIEKGDTPEISGKRVVSPEYLLTLSGDSGKNEDGVTIRLLNESGEDVAVMALDGETWRMMPSETRGQYVCFTMDGDSMTVCLVKSEKAVVRTVILCSAAAVAVLLLFFFLIRKRKKKRAAKKNDAAK